MALTTKQSRLIAALLVSRNLTEAAQTAGISIRTLQRHMADSEFREALQLAQTEALNHAQRRLSHLVLRAVDTLADCLESTAAPENRQAADSIFKNLRILREMNDFEARLTALEARMGANE